MAYEVEFPDGFITIEELLSRVLTTDDQERLPYAREAFATKRIQRSGKVSLADLRLAKGFTQRQLADRANVTQPRLSLWEARKEKPTIDHVLALASALDTDCNTIIGALYDA